MQLWLAQKTHNCSTVFATHLSALFPCLSPFGLLHFSCALYALNIKFFLLAPYTAYCETDYETIIEVMYAVYAFEVHIQFWI